MQTRLSVRASALLVVWAFVASSASAHPGSGIVVDKEGQVFFTDTGRGVWKIDAKGKLTDLPGSRFHWLALDEPGRFADSERSFGEWFERVTPKGAKPCIIQCSDFPVTIGSDGNLYYTDTREGRGRIVRRTPEGKETVLARERSLESIDGITPGPDDSLYVTQNTGGKEIAVRKITMAGAVSTIASGFVGTDPIKDPPADTPAAYCRGLAVDAAGVVYVAATGSRRVLKITPQGKVNTILESPGPWQPTGIALFDGDVYVLEWREPPAAQLEDRPAWLPRVRKIARDGTISTVATVSR
ncbi:MAG: SMP-30/gluconolactonase/LRE family protein [Tepidisphaeraceae bacterium]